MRRTIGLGLLMMGLALQVATAEMVFDDGAYGAGTKAMNEQRWQDAVTNFDRVIQSQDKKTDAALYWKAYSLKKLGNAQASVSTCDMLRARFAASSWNSDCSILNIQTQVNEQVSLALSQMPPTPSIDVLSTPSIDMEGVGHVRTRTPDEDLKILAMNSLLNQDPAKAVPLLRGILAGNQPLSLKKHALFVLAQSKTPEAEATLRDAVLGKMGPDVQHDAIQSVAVFLGKKDSVTLVEVYKATSDPRIKRSVVSALFISHDAPRLVDLARGEKDMELKRTIVSQLAMMQDKTAQDYMMELLK
jgi:hypothetical protein